MRLYATPADVAATKGGCDIPATEAERLIRIASRIVDTLLIGRRYTVDAEGMPTDSDDVTALKDATCAIVAELHSTGATAPGGTTEWGSVSIGNVSLSNPSSSASALEVDGLPVPAVAAVYLADVGTVCLQVYL